MDRRYRSLSGTRKTDAQRRHRSKSKDSSTRDAQLWGAVALQQHLSRSVASTGFQGLRAPAPLRPGHLTLAQKMGIVEAPPPKPSEEQWGAVESKAAQRQEITKSCAICHEGFVATAGQPQAILSCGHLFHETCIKQFEQFVRKAGQTPSCPICRKASYHRRKHVAGTAQVQHFAATRIQALARGRAARKIYLKMRLAADPKFKSDYYYDKLQSMSDTYLAYAAAREKAVDAFLEEIDLQRQVAAADMFREADWERVRQQILEREDRECPICMGSILSPKEGDDVSAAGAATMLSCSHCYHEKCLASLENYFSGKEELGGGRTVASLAGGEVPRGDGTWAIPRCPVCRSGYRRRPLFSD